MNDSLQMTGTIAIVDDDEPLREALGSVLKAAGFVSTAFASAEDFLNFTDREATDCLILDVRLPGMSGVELQRRLIEEGSRIPIVFVSAHGNGSLRELVLNAGAVGFLNKPVRSDALLKEIDSALRKVRSARNDRNADPNANRSTDPNAG